MPPAAVIDAPTLWRRGLLPMVMLLLAMVLVACSAGTQLGDGGTTTVAKGKTPPPVALEQLVGIPPDKAKALKDALAVAAGQHDIGIVEGSFQTGTFALSGNFRAAMQAGASQIAYSFELRDDNGVLVDTIAGNVTAGTAIADDPWSAVSTIVLQQIAESVSREMASKLALMGYATRMSSLITPPAYLFVAAGPGAQFDIDLETLDGPSAIEPVATPPAEAEQDVAALAPKPETPPPPETGADKSGTVDIKVVAVVPVEGSPGPGNGDLTEAMRRTLKSAGWPVVNAPRADALIVRGMVDLSKPQGVSQQVALRWAVETPQGKSLGDVKQANSVPAGSLDAGWGAAAADVTEAAASGIFEIIKKYR